MRLDEGKNGNSDVLVIGFDICRGRAGRLYKRNYDSQTQEDKKWKGVYRLYCPQGR